MPSKGNLAKRKKGWNIQLTLQLLGIFLVIALPISNCLESSIAPDLTQLPNVTCIPHDAKVTCDCNGQLMHLPPFPEGNTFAIDFLNCKGLIVYADTLKKIINLRKVNFENIEHLTLQENGLRYSSASSKTPLIIDFKNVVLDMIDSHAFNGNIEELSFSGGRIKTMKPFSFTSSKEKVTLIKMDSVWLGKIEPQAFKRLTIEKLEITNSVFETNVPSNTFYDLEITDVLLINNVRFKEVYTRAFYLKKISKLIITNNYFDQVHSEYIDARILKKVSIRDNNFGITNDISFKGITVHPAYIGSEQLELQFINNTLRFENDNLYHLEFNPLFSLNIKNLKCDNIYSCSSANVDTTSLQPKDEFLRKFMNEIYFRRQNNAIKSDENQSFIVLAESIADCKPHSYWLYILIGSLCLGLLLIVVIIVCYCKWVQRNKRRKMDIVMPEPRTYKETQIVYQIENAGLLKTDF